MGKAGAIRVLVADDHAVVRDGIAAIIEREPDMTVVGLVGDGGEAVAVHRAQQPDVALVDLRMPRMDGVAAIAAIRAESPHARLIVLTTYDGDEDIYRGLQAGARGYLLKDASAEQLLDAVRAVHGGARRIAPEAAQRLAERAPGQELSPRERDVLRLMAQGKSNREIAAGLGIGEGTVKTHVNQVLAKMGVADRTQAVVAALKRGLARL